MRNWSFFRCLRVVCLGAGLVAGLLSPQMSSAVGDVAEIAKTYVVSGGAVEPGDVVVFSRAEQRFFRASLEADPDVFGVVASSPVVELRTSAEGVPLVTQGETMAKVSTVNGAISVGDYLTTSAVPGTAERSSRSSDVVLGVALEPFPLDETLRSSADTTKVYTGTIRVLVKVGVQPGRGGGDGLGAGLGAGSGGSATGLNTPLANIIKYALAALVVIGSMYLAFHNFGSTLKDSIVSVGRNPLAKSAIQSMVVINITLVIVITAVGLFIGLMILFVQL